MKYEYKYTQCSTRTLPLSQIQTSIFPSSICTKYTSSLLNFNRGSPGWLICFISLKSTLALYNIFFPQVKNTGIASPRELAYSAMFKIHILLKRARNSFEFQLNHLQYRTLNLVNVKVLLNVLNTVELYILYDLNLTAWIIACYFFLVFLTIYHHVNIYYLSL